MKKSRYSESQIILRILLIMNADSDDREHSPWSRIGFDLFLTQVFTISQLLIVLSAWILLSA